MTFQHRITFPGSGELEYPPTLTAHCEVPGPVVHTSPDWHNSPAACAGFMPATPISFYSFLEIWKGPETNCSAGWWEWQGLLGPIPCCPSPPETQATVLLSAKSPNWKALRLGKEHVPAGWLGKVLGIHYDLNNSSSYSCDSALESGIFLCPRGWVLLSQCWKGHLVSSPGLKTALPHPPEDTTGKQTVGKSFPECSVSFLNKQPTCSHTALTAHICQSSGHFEGEVIRNSHSGIMHSRVHLPHVNPAPTMRPADC